MVFVASMNLRICENIFVFYSDKLLSRSSAGWSDATKNCTTPMNLDFLNILAKIALIAIMIIILFDFDLTLSSV